MDFMEGEGEFEDEFFLWEVELESLEVMFEEEEEDDEDGGEEVFVFGGVGKFEGSIFVDGFFSEIVEDDLVGIFVLL